jgi:hypothetical protein
LDWQIKKKGDKKKFKKSTTKNGRKMQMAFNTFFPSSSLDIYGHYFISFDRSVVAWLFLTRRRRKQQKSEKNRRVFTYFFWNVNKITSSFFVSIHIFQSPT